MSDAENSAPETPEDSKKSLSRDDSGNDDSQDVNGEKSEIKTPQKKEKSIVKKKTTPKKSSHKKESSSDDDEQEDDEKPAKKDQTEHNAKKDKKEDEEDDDDEEEDDEDDDEKDKKVALLDQPLEVSGSRERKKVERLALSFNLPSKEKKADIPEGEGTKLGECPRIEFQIQKGKVDDLKALHKVLFNRPGSNSEIRKNIRMFCGFPFKRSSQEFNKKKGGLERLNLSVLKKLCNVLDVDRGKTKDDMVNKVLEFLMKPSPSGKKVPAASKRRSSTKSGKRSTKKKRNARSRKNLDKDDSKSDSDSEEAELDDDETEDEVEEDEEEDEESEEGEEAVAAVASEKESEESEDNKKGKGKKPVSRKTPKKETKAKEEPKKEDKPTTAKVQQKRKNDESEGDDSSDDEPLAKKSKQPPSDEEIKTLIKKILDGANLEEITMKTVCKQVYATYPEFDLSERKNFIKETVKSIIS